MFVLFVDSTSEYRKGREQEETLSILSAHAWKGRQEKEGGGHACRPWAGTRYSQERDASIGLADAQPGTLGLYVTAGKYPNSALGVVLNRRDAVIGGGGRGQCFE
jgi:hypothetical protein